ncbi:MAG: translation initiation factor IF-2, partial [Candidatus Aenigmarchaeota archaeon]|nr:translation initiation factor IF-2 [Candidatus Aenigmarchaeota archaeon]
LSQQFLKDKLQISDIAKGSVLEVKDVRGLGTTIDVILYDGRIKTGDYLVIGGRNPLVTKIKALLEPRPLQELRGENQFDYTNEIVAAAGVKISAVGFDEVIAGSPIIAVKSEEEIEAAKRLVQKELEEIIYERNPIGITVKVDTLGSLEAIIKLLKEKGIPIRNAEVGNVTRQDVMETKNVSDSFRRVIIAFNQKVPEEVAAFSKDLEIKIFENNVIYRLLEEYEEWYAKEIENNIQEKLENVARPCEIQVLRGTIFRQHSPAIFGVEVVNGVVNQGILLKQSDGKIVGKIKEIQKEGKSVSEAKKGDKVAISMNEPTVGRHIFEGDKLVSVISEDDLKVLRKFLSYLSASEQELLKTFFE